MNAKTSKILRYILSALLAAVLLYFSFRKVRWSDFKDVLQQCRWGYVALSMIFGVLSSAVRALRWRLLLSSMDSDRGWWRAFNAVNIGKLTDLALPHAGEFVRCGYIASPATPYNRILGSVALERSWDIISLLLLILVLLTGGQARFGDFFASKIWEPLSGRVSIKVLAIALAVVAAIVLSIVLSRGIRRFAKGLWEGFVTCIKMPRKGLFLVQTVALWLCFLMMCWFMIKAIPQVSSMDLFDALFIMLTGSLASIVPVPGGFGAFHYLIAIALNSIYGIPFEMGIVFATLSHESQALTTIVFGLGSLVFEAIRRRS